MDESLYLTNAEGGMIENQKNWEDHIESNEVNYAISKVISQRKLSKGSPKNGGTLDASSNEVNYAISKVISQRKLSKGSPKDGGTLDASSNEVNYVISIGHTKDVPDNIDTNQSLFTGFAPESLPKLTTSEAPKQPLTMARALKQPEEAKEQDEEDSSGLDYEDGVLTLKNGGQQSTMKKLLPYSTSQSCVDKTPKIREYDKDKKSDAIISSLEEPKMDLFAYYAPEIEAANASSEEEELKMDRLKVDVDPEEYYAEFEEALDNVGIVAKVNQHIESKAGNADDSGYKLDPSAIYAPETDTMNISPEEEEHKMNGFANYAPELDASNALLSSEDPKRNPFVYQASEIDAANDRKIETETEKKFVDVDPEDYYAEFEEVLDNVGIVARIEGIQNKQKMFNEIKCDDNNIKNERHNKYMHKFKTLLYVLVLCIWAFYSIKEYKKYPYNTKHDQSKVYVQNYHLYQSSQRDCKLLHRDSHPTQRHPIAVYDANSYQISKNKQHQNQLKINMDQVRDQDKDRKYIEKNAQKNYVYHQNQLQFKNRNNNRIISRNSDSCSLSSITSIESQCNEILLPQHQSFHSTESMIQFNLPRYSQTKSKSKKQSKEENHSRSNYTQIVTVTFIDPRGPSYRYLSSPAPSIDSNNLDNSGQHHFYPLPPHNFNDNVHKYKMMALDSTATQSKTTTNISSTVNDNNGDTPLSHASIKMKNDQLYSGLLSKESNNDDSYHNPFGPLMVPIQTLYLYLTSADYNLSLIKMLWKLINVLTSTQFDHEIESQKGLRLLLENVNAYDLADKMRAGSAHKNIKINIINALANLRDVAATYIIDDHITEILSCVYSVYNHQFNNEDGDDAEDILSIYTQVEALTHDSEFEIKKSETPWQLHINALTWTQLDRDVQSQRALSSLLKDPSKDPINEPTKDSTEDPSGYTIKEPIKDLIKDPIKAQTSDPSKDLTKEQLLIQNEQTILYNNSMEQLQSQLAITQSCNEEYRENDLIYHIDSKGDPMNSAVSRYKYEYVQLNPESKDINNEVSKAISTSKTSHIEVKTFGKIRYDNTYKLKKENENDDTKIKHIDYDAKHDAKLDKGNLDDYKMNMDNSYDALQALSPSEEPKMNLFAYYAPETDVNDNNGDTLLYYVFIDNNNLRIPKKSRYNAEKRYDVVKNDDEANKINNNPSINQAVTIQREEDPHVNVSSHVIHSKERYSFTDNAYMDREQSLQNEIDLTLNKDSAHHSPHHSSKIKLNRSNKSKSSKSHHLSIYNQPYNMDKVQENNAFTVRCITDEIKEIDAANALLLSEEPKIDPFAYYAPETDAVNASPEEEEHKMNCFAYYAPEIDAANALLSLEDPKMDPFVYHAPETDAVNASPEDEEHKMDCFITNPTKEEFIEHEDDNDLAILLSAKVLAQILIESKILSVFRWYYEHIHREYTCYILYIVSHIICFKPLIEFGSITDLYLPSNDTKHDEIKIQEEDEVIPHQRTIHSVKYGNFRQKQLKTVQRSLLIATASYGTEKHISSESPYVTSSNKADKSYNMRLDRVLSLAKGVSSNRYRLNDGKEDLLESQESECTEKSDDIEAELENEDILVEETTDDIIADAFKSFSINQEIETETEEQYVDVDPYEYRAECEKVLVNVCAVTKVFELSSKETGHKMMNVLFTFFALFAWNWCRHNDPQANRTNAQNISSTVNDNNGDAHLSHVMPTPLTNTYVYHANDIKRINNEYVYKIQPTSENKEDNWLRWPSYLLDNIIWINDINELQTLVTANTNAQSIINTKEMHLDEMYNINNTTLNRKTNAIRTDHVLLDPFYAINPINEDSLYKTHHEYHIVASYRINTY